MNYYKRHIGDYAAKAGHLSPLEHGVYTLLLDAYYNREEGPTRAEAIRWARARSEDEVAAVDAVLTEFFVEVEGRFVQGRVEEELASFRVRRDTNRQLGARGGKAKAERNASESLSDCEANAKPSHKPLATSHKEDQEQAAAPEILIPLDDGTEHPVTAGDLSEYRAAYPLVDVLAELRKARAWCVSNPANRKTRRGVGKFVNGWLSRANDDAAKRAPQPAKIRRQL